MCPRARDFQPTDNQRKALSYVQDCGYDFEVKPMCESLGFSREAYYAWFDRQEFSTYWARKAKAFFAQKLPQIYKALYGSGTGKSKAKVSVNALRHLLELLDPDFPPEPNREPVQPTQVVIITETAKVQVAEDAKVALAEIQPAQIIEAEAVPLPPSVGPCPEVERETEDRNDDPEEPDADGPLG